MKSDWSMCDVLLYLKMVFTLALNDCLSFYLFHLRSQAVSHTVISFSSSRGSPDSQMKAHWNVIRSQPECSHMN